MLELTNQLNEIKEGIRSLSQSVDQRKLRQARLLACAGDYGQACQEIEGHTFSEQRQRVEALLLLAKVFAQQGVFEKASAYWKQVLRVDSENKEALSGLAAISKQFARPPLQRMWGFFVASVMFITLIALLVSFLDSRIHDVDSRIVSTSTDSRTLTLQQSSQITDDIQSLRKTSADELGIAMSDINSLKKNVVRAEARAVRREQALKEQVDSAFVKFQKELALYHKAFGTQLTSLETNSIDRMSTIFQQQEKESALIQEQLNNLALTLASYEEDLKAINKEAEAQNFQKNAAQVSIANRLHTVEKQLSLIHAILLQVKPSLLPNGQENTKD